MRGRFEVVGRRQRALRPLLATRPSEVVSSDRLVDALWGNDPPANVLDALQTVALCLLGRRRRPCADTATGLYALDVRETDVDAMRFERLADAGRRALAAGDPGLAGEKLRAALGLWGGTPLAEFRDS